MASNTRKVVTDTNMEFEHQCHNGQKLFAERNKDYRDAYKRYGFMGIVYEILGILSKLETVVIWAPDNGRSKKSKIIDILLDLHNYTVMALMVLQSDNWDGRQPDPDPEDLP